jgi:hypothetical protein
MSSLFQQYDKRKFDETAEETFYNELDEAAACEDVRRMAETLAPQMSELEDVLKDFSVDDDEVSNAVEIAESANRTMEEEDDDLNDELQQLAMSEQVLREELEFAQDMNTRLSVMYSPPKQEQEQKNAPEDPQVAPRMDPPTAMVTPTKPPRPTADPSKVKPPLAYTLQDHADHLQLQTEKVGGWYYCDTTQHLLPVSTVSTDMVKDYCLPIPFRKLKRLYSGLLYHQVVGPKAAAATPSKAPQTPSTPTQTPFSTTAPMTPASSKRPPTLPSTPATPAAPSSQAPMLQEEPLPVRTVAIRIRPDVLCGAVMDAVHHAFEMLPNNCTTHILKRQGGHLRGAVYIPDMALAYVADVQLCSQKNDELERRLIVRYYHIQDDPEAMHELGQHLQQQVPPSPALEGAPPPIQDDNEKMAANRHMKQCCSLIQRLMAAQRQGAKKLDHKQQSSWLGLQDTAFDSKAEMQKSIGSHLESNFKTCPSVREENKKALPTIRRLTLPSLSAKDWPLLDVSWTLTSSIMEELDTRDCTHNTLSTLPFGQFPSLPTLDVHYCSQLRRLSRESMITHLLKSAKELEDYAKGAEYNCAICITLLVPMLEHYGIPPLNLPTASMSLQDYPLEYTPPQVSCPPWGSVVMEALNQVTAKTPSGDIEVDEAVRMIYAAFIRQDDEEQAARLGRKNAQIMERLASMQSHQRALVQNIRDAHVYSEKASEEAHAFSKRAQQAVNAGREGFPRVLQPEVPLLSFRVSLGASSSGTCYVTSNQMLFATTYIPLVGGTKTTLFDLGLVDFQVDDSVASTLLNPFPNTMNVVVKSSNQVVYSFRPVLGPARLHKLLNVIQSFVGEETPSEFSQVVDSVQVVEEDGVMRLTDTPSEDQLSI